MVMLSTKLARIANTPKKIITHPRPASQTFLEAREYVFRSFISKGSTNEQAKEIEKSIIEYTKHECRSREIKELRWSDVGVRRIYIRKSRMLLNNMPELLEMLRKNETTCWNITSIDHYTIKPDLWMPIIARSENKRTRSLITDSEIRYDGLLKCDACKSWNTRFVTVQTRSADEPMTVFATCMDCSNHWTDNGK